MLYKIVDNQNSTEEAKDEALATLELMTFEDRAEFSKSEKFKAEQTGIMHLVHAWYPKGHNVRKQ